MTVEQADPLADLLAAESAPVLRSRYQYVLLLVGGLVTLAMGVVLLLVVVPWVGNLIATLLQKAPLLTTPK
ncbi:hypothetical protein ACFPJ4_07630 [Lysinimonas soli]|uniref:Uncharacterized protein n=1 Tax=Lysinimonas soli TaxID=1074233 RepID=A0ABW0NQ20_9MICO